MSDNNKLTKTVTDVKPEQAVTNEIQLLWELQLDMDGS